MKISRKRIIMFIALCAAIVLVVVLFVAVMTYRNGSDNTLVRAVQRVVPLPAARVGWNIVSIDDVRRNMEATRRFYEHQKSQDVMSRIDFSTREGQQRFKLWEPILLDKLIEDAAVYAIAKRNGITLTDAEIHARVKQELDRNGTGRVAQRTIYSIWGFTLPEFEERIVKPQMYREALEKHVQQTVEISSLRKRAQEAHGALMRGEDFHSVFAQYSDIKEGDGDAGWFTFMDLMPQVSQVAFSLDIGTFSDVIETPRGFHIIMVDDRRIGDGAQGAMVKLRHIMIEKPRFSQWLDKQMRTLPIRVYMPGYAWDTESQHVIITDPELAEMNTKIREEINRAAHSANTDTADKNEYTQ